MPKPLLSRQSPEFKQKLLKSSASSDLSSSGSGHKSIFQTLDKMEREADLMTQAGQSRWMVPYADLLTLLLGLFLALFTAYAPKMEQADKAEAAAAVAKVSSAAKKTAQAPQLEKQLRSTIHLPGLDILHQERGVVLSLKDNILFEAGKADLSPNARKTLDHIAQDLRSAMGNKVSPIRIEGHTDNTPIATSHYPSNWELSTARATQIVRYLVESGRWTPAKISAVGYGEFRPLSTNSSIEGKRKNRRVDIVILNEGTQSQEAPISN